MKVVLYMLAFRNDAEVVVLSSCQGLHIDICPNQRSGILAPLNLLFLSALPLWGVHETKTL